MYDKVEGGDNLDDHPLTKKEALLEALRLLLDHELIEVSGITVYFRRKNDDSSKQDLSITLPDDLVK